MLSNPLLKQFAELKLSDLENYPIWVNCHTVDYDEPWYDKTDEETFRPWVGDIPVDPNEAIFLVKSTFTLADGTVLEGFITPVGNVNEDVAKVLGMVQPYIFDTKGKLVQFWFSGVPFLDENIKNMYLLLGKTSKDVFPIEFEANPSLVNGITRGVIPGFCYLEKNGEIIIKK